MFRFRGLNHIDTHQEKQENRIRFSCFFIYALPVSRKIRTFAAVKFHSWQQV